MRRTESPARPRKHFWVDVWIPASTEPKVYRGQARLACGSGQKAVPLELTVLPAVIPAEDAVTRDQLMTLSTGFPKAKLFQAQEHTSKYALVIDAAE